ncbi:MAG: hypothetical protein A2902_06010 [Elusimicrobia bacterium RIFCSPLOWO2_01_FULL_64_13]|nr:MAG: hypothetical protein A2902_06010 [Elusimicrobia bacterium RIFCSPLOWO2_01_FULL_64_13]
MARPRKVLIIDDDFTVVDYVSELLANWGYECAASGTGADGIEKFADGGFDLVLLDVMLSDTDGVTLCRRLKSAMRERQVPIIVMSSLSDPTTIQDARMFGAADYIRKPFDEKQFKAKIEKALDRA